MSNWIDDAHDALSEIQDVCFLVGYRFDSVDALVEIQRIATELVGGPDPTHIAAIRACALPPDPSGGAHAPEEEGGRCPCCDGTGKANVDSYIRYEGEPCSCCQPSPAPDDDLNDADEYDRSGGIINVQCYKCGHEWSSMTLADPCPKCGDLPRFEDDEEDDVDILARVSDHVPGESSREAELDQHHRDGQRWTSYEPAKARALLKEEAEPCPSCLGSRHSIYWTPDYCGRDELICEDCNGTGRARSAPNEFRRAWLAGIAEGLEHGPKGLRPRTEPEEEATAVRQMAAHYEPLAADTPCSTVNCDNTATGQYAGMAWCDECYLGSFRGAQEEPCEVCTGARFILVAHTPILDGDGEWTMSKRRIPCPECTQEGRTLIDAENERDMAEYYASLARDAALADEQGGHTCPWCLVSPTIPDDVVCLVCSERTRRAEEAEPDPRDHGEGYACCGYQGCMICTPPRSFSEIDLMLRGAD